MSKFNGKVAVVTGGNSGIGLASAKELASQGAKVVIAGRDQKTLDAAVASIGENALGVQADVSKLGDIEKLFAQTAEKFGKVDVLFVNAGVAQFAPLEQSDEELFDRIVDINFKGSFFTVKTALPHLNDGASIIFTTSAATKKGMAGVSVYAASKSALLSLVKVFAAELAPRGIRVNAISPGPIDTPIFNRSGLPEATIESMRAGMISQVPLGRIGNESDVAKAVAFLASDDSTFVTGTELDVDGGMGQL